MTENEFKKVLENCPQNIIIFDSFGKSYSTVPQFKSVAVAVSGGSDSDIVVDIFKKLFYDIELHFVWYDTGVEYQATKDHLKYLEDKYNMTIKRIKAIKPIPVSCKEYGQPFISKYVSEMIMRLQKNDFKFEDKSFDILLKEYPNCKVALKWWCNENGNNSTFNIDRNKYLKEFLIASPPTFKISNQCCQWAKKKVAHKFIRENGIDLNVIGVRKSEGGIRNVAYTTCFDRGTEVSSYRPIFWYRDYEKIIYNSHYKVINSLCYSKYGLSRTGCAGCPFARDFEEELKVIERNEPKLFKAVNNIFGSSYAYTRAYRKFANDLKESNNTNHKQLSMYDFLEDEK